MISFSASSVDSFENTHLSIIFGEDLLPNNEVVGTYVPLGSFAIIDWTFSLPSRPFRTLCHHTKCGKDFTCLILCQLFSKYLTMYWSSVFVN